MPYALSFYNSLTRQKEAFTPIDPQNVRVYACGPTVYNRVHIGNMRMIVVFDMLFRLLRATYGVDNVTFARNITDIDDKIMKKAVEENATIETISQRYTEAFISDYTKLGTLSPTHQPRATEYLDQMIKMISGLIDKGHAYEAEGHVLFHVPSFKDYGCLSRQSRDDQIAGARVEVAPYKKDPADFVLWKPSTGDQPGWDSPWGFGRPGWHIECSVMSTDLLGENFDIHCGGQDLTFPHHENEIAQSCCAHPQSQFAHVWMHNGMLNVDGQKMSKSLGNFYMMPDLEERGFVGEEIRFALLNGHYRAPLEFSFKKLEEGRKALETWYNLIETKLDQPLQSYAAPAGVAVPDVLPLADDLNSAKAIAHLHANFNALKKGTHTDATLQSLAALSQILGFCEDADRYDASRNEVGKPIKASTSLPHGITENWINEQISARTEAKKARDFAKADNIRDALISKGIILKDSADGTTWETSC